MRALGRHILIEFYGCSSAIMNDVEIIEKSMLTAAEKAETTIINSTFHHFSPYGVSGVIVIQESHLAIHTWPEYKYAALDLFTCGDVANPWVSFDFLKKAFKASNYSAMEMLRGSLDQLKRIDFDIQTTGRVAQQALKKERYQRNVWFTDKDNNQALSLRHSGEVLFKEQSAYQKISVLETYAYGKMLTIDNMVMCTEKDEAHYHEMITHPVLFTNPQIKKVLVIGGGDGGTIREIFKHPSIHSVTMVEIDEVVIKASKKYLKTIATAFDNPKLNLIINNGIKFVETTPQKSYDLIIVDGSDPVGPAQGLFSQTFYAHCYRLLTQKGILITQNESPMFNRQSLLKTYKCLKYIFGNNPKKLSPLLFFAPTYPSGMWSLLAAFKDKNNLKLDTKQLELLEKKLTALDLKYYNTDIHQAALALPNFFKTLLNES